LKVRNILTTFDEFAGREILTSRNIQDYHSLYIDLYEYPSYKSKVSSQILYGEKFKILLKKKNWFKIKTSYC